MLLAYCLLCSAAAGAPSSAKKEVRWFVPLLERNYQHEATMITRHRKSMTGAIVWTFMAINHSTGSCTPTFNESFTATLLRPWKESGLSLQVGYCAGALSRGSLSNGSALGTIDSVVSFATHHGFDSINVDFEQDALNHSMAEALPFLDFVGNLSAAAHKSGLRIQVDTTAQGVGMHYAELVARGADSLMPMSQTYFGLNISKDREMVARYKNAIPVSKLHVGLSASMNASGAAHCKHGDNGWTAESLRNWLQWIGEQGVSRVDVFQCWGWEYIQEFVFDELAAWLQSPVAASARQEVVAAPVPPARLSGSVSDAVIAGARHNNDDRAQLVQ